jgi:hypothetical protein
MFVTESLHFTERKAGKEEESACDKMGIQT